MKKLGLGIQELSELRKDNYIYVDKTEVIHKLITTGKYYFLSRPRRFGKSLLVNTIEEIFRGNKDLFKETWIYDKWNFEEKSPVIKIDFSRLSYHSSNLKDVLSEELDTIAKSNNIVFEEDKVYSDKFKQLIQELGKENPVVILIDEYDKPIIDYIETSKKEKAEENREILKGFYSVIKGSDRYIKLLFITGISKFSKVSLFSELNNLTDITINRKYATITGYTEKEIADNYGEYLESIKKDFGFDRKGIMDAIRLWYNGYSWDAETFVYNPYSVINFFEAREFKNFWFRSGTPTFLTKFIKDNMVDFTKFDTKVITDDDTLDSYDINNIDLTVLLFQAGYLTIKEKIIDPEFYSVSYNLGYPNMEVRESFYKFLIADYTSIDKTTFSSITRKLKGNLAKREIDQFFLGLKSVFADIPFNIFMEKDESYYHSIIYLTMKLVGADIIPENGSSRGRVDAVVSNPKHIYIIEFKMSSVNDALKQIEKRKYYEPYLYDGREIICIGVAFDRKERNIKDYGVVSVEELLGEKKKI
ncbi:MAG: AAA family ATPase [Candidatus Delongbacteria bacterium]|nr:MAG: AAA family ATPase [Candidatus Delongbacteria bacterium]